MSARIPRSWASYFHPQGAGRGGSQLNFRPGYRGTGMQPIRSVPIGAYTQKATGVPLTGGQNQAIIPGIPAGSGSITSPGAFAAIIRIIIPVAGTYTVHWTVSLAGTLSAGDANNFHLDQNGILVAASVNPAAAGTYVQTPAVITAAAGDEIEVFAVAAGTTGSVYGAVIPAQASPLTLTAGPQGLGTIWYPAQVTLSTTTGVLDTSTALCYLGSQGVPITLVASVFSGNGTVALAIPSMSPGQVLIVTWTNGHPGDTAAFNIVGTMDALTTG
jgi:hypothetical protein